MNIQGRFPSVTLSHVESSRIRDGIHVSCIGRWIVYQGSAEMIFYVYTVLITYLFKVM